jgi:hypothetical protein
MLETARPSERLRHSTRLRRPAELSELKNGFNELRASPIAVKHALIRLRARRLAAAGTLPTEECHAHA